jgi:hypothetical protein
MAFFREIEKLYLLLLTELFFLLIVLAVATYSQRPELAAPDVVNHYLARGWECSKCGLGKWEILLWRRLWKAMTPPRNHKAW